LRKVKQTAPLTLSRSSWQLPVPGVAKPSDGRGRYPGATDLVSGDQRPLVRCIAPEHQSDRSRRAVGRSLVRQGATEGAMLPISANLRSLPILAAGGCPRAPPVERAFIGRARLVKA